MIFSDFPFVLSGISVSLLLILLANGAPVIARKLLGNRWNQAIDRASICSDRRPLLGVSKTWRGLIASLIITSLGSAIMGMGLWLGFWFALFSMLGDLTTSFIKRRCAMPASSHAPGLDILFESLLPLTLLRNQLEMSWLDILICVLLFFLFEEFVSPLLYRLHLRNRPY